MNHIDPALITVNDIWWVPHTVKAIPGRRCDAGPDRGACETGN